LPTLRQSQLLYVAFHTIDYLTYPENSAAKRDTYRKECADFAVIDRFAHAFKHVETGHENSAIQPLAAKDVISRPPAFFEVGVWDLSRWDDQVGGVTVRQETSLDILQALRRTVEFLRSKLEAQHSGQTGHTA